MISPQLLANYSKEQQKHLLLLVSAMLEMKAVTIGDCSYCFKNLPQDKQESAIRALFIYLNNAEEICNAADFHQLHVNKLMKEGWSFGRSFNLAKKSTPFICAFAELPAQLQTFVSCQFAFLKVMSGPLLNTGT